MPKLNFLLKINSIFEKPEIKKKMYYLKGMKDTFSNISSKVSQNITNYMGSDWVKFSIIL